MRRVHVTKKGKCQTSPKDKESFKTKQEIISGCLCVCVIVCFKTSQRKKKKYCCVTNDLLNDDGSYDDDVMRVYFGLFERERTRDGNQIENKKIKIKNKSERKTNIIYG